MLPGHRELRTRQCEPTKLLSVINSEKDLREVEVGRHSSCLICLLRAFTGNILLEMDQSFLTFND